MEKTGKTYLLQSLCNHYFDEGKTSLLIPLKEVKDLGSQITESLENLDLICIDDVDLIAGDNSWEIAVFNLINNCLLTNCRLVFCSSFNPSNINFELKDLLSRIKKINHIELFPVNTNNLSKAIKFIANSRSINLGEREIDYLITYSERSIANLVNIISGVREPISFMIAALFQNIESIFMELKRKISVPLIKEVIRAE